MALFASFMVQNDLHCKKNYWWENKKIKNKKFYINVWALG